MKILWINANPNPNPGGTEAHSIDFINILENTEGITLYKVLAKGSYVDKHTDDQNKYFIKLKSEFSPVNTAKLLFIARKLKPDIVIGNNGNEYINTYLAGKVSSSRVIFFRHMLNRQPWFLRKFILPKVDKIIAVSDSSKKRLILDDIPQDKIEVVPNFIDEKKFYYDDREKQNIRESLGISKDEVVVSFLGKISRGKGIYDFFEISKTLATRDKRFKFLVIGYGRDLDIVRKETLLSGLNGRFIFTDKTDRPEYFLKASDILLALSKGEESFGRVVIEGFATKNLVIVYNIENLKYLVKDGYSGFVCENSDIACVSDRITKVLENRANYDKITENGYREFLENYTKVKIFNKFHNILKEVVGNRNV